MVIGCVATLVGWLFTGAQSAYAQTAQLLFGNTLQVDGTSGSDDFLIYVDGNDIVVEEDEVEIDRFDKSVVQNLFVDGHGGSDTIFCNQIDDADNTAIQQVILGGGAGGDTIHGTNVSGDVETIYGDEDSDYLLGYNGNDAIIGSGGNDTIGGGSGDDDIDGGDGNDIISGNDGEDDISGGANNDILQGGPAADILAGNSGTDTLYHFDQLWGITLRTRSTLTGGNRMR